MKFLLTLISTLFFITACSQDQTAGSEVEPETTETVAESTPATTSEESAEPQFEIENLAGDVYRGRSGRHFTVFMVTSEGTILADPISTEFAEWLKAELASQFNSTVRYVLYSHHHWDHASGGAVFQDTAELVGHENMIPGLAMPMPANYVGLDVNGDGSIQREEARGGLLNGFDGVDADGDGNITGDEINADVVAPTATYSENHSVYLGGKEAQLVYSGVNHSDDGSIIYFPEEAVAFGADWLNVKGFPRTLYGTSPADWAISADILSSLNPMLVVPGHGEVGFREDATAYAQYFKDLDAAAKSAAASGSNLEDFLSSLPMDAYAEWNGYDSTMLDNAREAFEMATVR